MTTCSGAFVVKGVESRQTNVEDFFLIESNYRVRRQSIARWTNGRSGRAAGQRQRPSDSQYRYGFRPTLSLRISIATRHEGGFPFHPHLRVPSYTKDGRNAAFECWIGTCGAAGHPIVRFGSPPILGCFGQTRARLAPKPVGEGFGRLPPCPLRAGSGLMHRSKPSKSRSVGRPPRNSSAED